MNIVLCTSPHIKHSSVLESDFDSNNDSMYNFAPLGLLMLIAVTKQVLGITPTIYDVNDNINTQKVTKNDFFYQNVATSICEESPDILGFMTECDSYHHVLQICKEIKIIRPNCKIILGGPHATAVALKTMEQWDCIDFIVLGEGELTFVEIVKSIIGNLDINIAGAYYRDAKSKINYGGVRALVESLDSLPFPAYEQYLSKLGEELFIEVGRGCPFNCTFCSTSPFWQRKHRVKSPQRIIDEIFYIQKIHNVKRFHFTHDLFTTNEHWVKNVCTALIEADCNIKWTCSSRVDTINENLIKIMSEAGCNAIYFGVESGSDEILSQIDKKIPFSKTLEIIKLCEKYNITANAGLILGFPFETEKSIGETFDAYLKLLENGAKPVHIFSFCPFAQSSIYGDLQNMTCSGYFLDIPISRVVDEKNRNLICSNVDLFGSYFRPTLKNVHSIDENNLFAIDEFSILIDTLQVPSIFIAQKLEGGMKKLFLNWLIFISNKNTLLGKNKYRKYFGSPIDFCDFLLEEIKIFIQDDLTLYIQTLIKITQKSLQISFAYKSVNALTMANYRSKVIDFKITKINIDSTLRLGKVIDTYQSEYDMTHFFENSRNTNYETITKGKYNLIWYINKSNDISLITVNDFIYSIILKTKEQEEYPLKNAILNGISDFEESENSLPNLLNDIEIACANDLLLINEY